MSDEIPVEAGVDETTPPTTCPACGGEVATVRNADGGISAEAAHSKCYKAPSKGDLKEAAQAAAAQMPVETGVTEDSE